MVLMSPMKHGKQILFTVYTNVHYIYIYIDMCIYIYIYLHTNTPASEDLHVYEVGALRLTELT